jgi:hypothetical protein
MAGIVFIGLVLKVKGCNKDVVGNPDNKISYRVWILFITNMFLL